MRYPGAVRGAGVLLTIAALSTAAAASEQAVPRPGAGRGVGRVGAPARPAGATRTVAEVEQMFDRYVLAQARQALQLNPGQFRQFGPRLQRLQMLRRRAVRQRQVLVRELGELTREGAGTDESALAAKLAALETAADRSDQEVRQAYRDLEAVLTVAQRARLPVFEQRMERRKLELMAQARRDVRQAGRSTEAAGTGEPSN